MVCLDNEGKVEMQLIAWARDRGTSSICHSHASSSRQTFVPLPRSCGVSYLDFHSTLRRTPRVCKVERIDHGHVRLDRLHFLVTSDADTVIAVLDEVGVAQLVQSDCR
jgi:hypothetical protein